VRKDNGVEGFVPSWTGKTTMAKNECVAESRR